MSFRQYGGINYAARNNIVKNNYTNANNLSIMNKVGQTNSIINVDSGLYMSSNLTFKNMGAPYYGITFSDGTTQRSATTTTDTYWQPYDSAPTPVIYYTNQVIVGADPYVTGGTLDSGTKLAVNGNVSISNSTSGKAGVIQLADYSITPTATCRIASYNGNNYIESGVNSVDDSSAPLLFTTVNGSTTWMTIDSSGNVGIGTIAPAYKLDVSGNMIVSEDTTLGNSNVNGSTVLTINGNTNIGGKLTAWHNSSSISQGVFTYGTINSNIDHGTLLSSNGDVTEIKMNNASKTHFTINNNGSFNIINTSKNTNPYTGGTINMTINSSGNVGIGTDNPLYKLDVSGNMNVSSNLLLSTNGSYLQFPNSKQQTSSYTGLTTAGSYTNTNINVDANGKITGISSGSSGVASIPYARYRGINITTGNIQGVTINTNGGTGGSWLQNSYFTIRITYSCAWNFTGSANNSQNNSTTTCLCDIYPYRFSTNWGYYSNHTRYGNMSLNQMNGSSSYNYLDPSTPQGSGTSLSPNGRQFWCYNLVNGGTNPSTCQLWCDGDTGSLEFSMVNPSGWTGTSAWNVELTIELVAIGAGSASINTSGFNGGNTF